MKYILGVKKEMTQLFREDGTVLPATIVKGLYCVVTQVKSYEKDGYTAVQISGGVKKKITKPAKGHFQGLGSFRYVREFRLAGDETQGGIAVGKELRVEQFAVGDFVVIMGKSKGKGFQGVVRRHHFSGSPASHGHKDQLRHSGSIGAGGEQNVQKGMRMAGHMGFEQVTVKNLEVVRVESKTGCLYIKGAVPGARGTLIAIRAVD